MSTITCCCPRMYWPSQFHSRGSVLNLHKKWIYVLFPKDSAHHNAVCPNNIFNSFNINVSNIHLTSLYRH
ncbi:hypothetical protein EMIT0P260_100138 [Pseudomonas sp. IT-P260]